MKAVLVIDLDDDVNLDEVEIRYAIQDEYGMPVKAEVDGCHLKPLPPKLDANDWHRMFSGLFSEREAKGHGWNACLKEITGE